MSYKLTKFCILVFTLYREYIIISCVILSVAFTIYTCLNCELVELGLWVCTHVYLSKSTLVNVYM